MTTQFIEFETITDQGLQAAAGGKHRVNVVPAQGIQGPIVIGNPPAQPFMPSFPFSDSKNWPTFPAMPG